MILQLEKARPYRGWMSRKVVGGPLNTMDVSWPAKLAGNMSGVLEHFEWYTPFP